MPLDAPKHGRCSIALDNGRGFCAHKPAIPDSLGGNGRCKYHGGYLGLTNGTEAHKVQATQAREAHGLYSTALQATFRTARLQKVFTDPSTAKLDLTPEIRLWRTKCLAWQEQIQKGQLLLETDHDKFRLLDDVLYRGQLILSRLIKLQRELHPEADANGELVIRIEVNEGAAKQAAEMDMPNLEADAVADEAPRNPKDTNVDAIDDDEPTLNPLAEFDE